MRCKDHLVEVLPIHALHLDLHADAIPLNRFHRASQTHADTCPSQRCRHLIDIGNRPANDRVPLVLPVIRHEAMVFQKAHHRMGRKIGHLAGRR